MVPPVLDLHPPQQKKPRLEREWPGAEGRLNVLEFKSDLVSVDPLCLSPSEKSLIFECLAQCNSAPLLSCVGFVTGVGLRGNCLSSRLLFL